jgi:uncharacterized membrane protein
MTSVHRVVALLFSLFLLTSVQLANAADERSFEIGEVEIHARIDSDGNMHVTETDTYHFNGAFNGILVDLHTTGSDGIEHFQAFEVSDQQDIPLDIELSSDGDKLQYRIHSQSEDETKVFKFTYSLNNVVQVYADTAELYWKFFDETNPSTLGSVLINVELPDGAKQDEITAFGHGPLNGAIERPDSGVVRYLVSPLPSEKLLEVRVLFPTSYVPGSSKISTESMLDRILEEEQNWKDQTDNSTVVEDIIIALVILMVNLLVGALIYAKFGKAYKSDWKHKYSRELPSDVTPAIVSYLMKKHNSTSDLMATMLDLVRKKYVTMHVVKQLDQGEEDDYTFKLINTKINDLLPHEKALIRWFFEDVGRSGTVSLSDIRRQAENKKRANAFMNQWSKWQDHVQHSANRLNYFEKRPKNEKRYGWMVIAAALQAFGLIWLVGLFHYIWLCPLPLILFWTKSELRSQIGQTEYAKWKAFKRFLRDYSRIASREPLAVHLWEHYYIYAIPLGMAKKVEAISHMNMAGESYETPYYDSYLWTLHDIWTDSFNKTIAQSGGSSSSSGDSGGTFTSGGGDGGGGGGRGAF